MRAKLWFDVGIKRYTTVWDYNALHASCGLMQESKDIQQKNDLVLAYDSCGLMQESKDIQPIMVNN